MRRTTFTIDASSVQGNEGAEVTFRALKVREDSGKPLPSPADDPDVLGELYVHEQLALARLLFSGPDGDSVKN